MQPFFWKTCIICCLYTREINENFLKRSFLRGNSTSDQKRPLFSFPCNHRNRTKQTPKQDFQYLSRARDTVQNQWIQNASLLYASSGQFWRASQLEQ